MAFLTADANIAHTENPSTTFVSQRVAAGAVIYKGALVGTNDEGYAKPLLIDDDVNQFVGIANVGVDNSSGADDDLQVECRVNEAILVAVAGADQSSIGSIVYASDDNTYILDTSPGIAVGTLVEFNTDGDGLSLVKLNAFLV